MPIILATLVLIADQIVKFVCAQWLPTLSGASYSVINGVFNLTYVENRGAAFGILSGAPWLLHIITGLLVAALIFILAARYKSMFTLMRFSLCLILAGALGNMIDRVFLGYVRDMFDFCLINFYVFNVADAAITLGAIGLALDILFFRGREFLQREFADEKKHDDNITENTADNIDNNIDITEQTDTENLRRGIKRGINENKKT